MAEDKKKEEIAVIDITEEYLKAYLFWATTQAEVYSAYSRVCFQELPPVAFGL